MSRYVVPSGFPEYLPATQAQFETLKQTLATSFARFGFTYLQTPAVEYLDTLASKGDINNEIYAITQANLAEGELPKTPDRGLRFDLTTPFARFVANHHGKLDFPFRRYQIDRVWRGERAQKGRYRELYQADIDIVAPERLPLIYDAEILRTIATTLEELDLFDFTVRVNDRNFLARYLEDFGVKSTALPAAFALLDKLKKVSPAEFKTRLQSECGLSAARAEDLYAKIQAPLPLTQYLQLSTDFAYLSDGLAALPLRRGKIVLDLSIVRGLDYYTGFVYETTVDGYEEFGSISSGGRYANLVSKFSKQAFPGVGGSIGLSRLFFILQETNLLPATPEPSGAYVLFLEPDRLRANQALAATLRTAKIRVGVQPEAAKFAKQIKYANANAYRFALILEEDETLTLKDIVTREQTTGLDVAEVQRILLDA